MPIRDDSQHAGAERDGDEGAMPSAVPNAMVAPCWTGWLLAAMAATMLVLGIDISFHPLPPPVSELFQDFASGSVFLGAAVLCVMKGRASHGERFAWLLFALAMTLYASGQVYYNVAYPIGADVPYPSVADGFWLAFYLPACAALFSLLRRRAGAASRGVWLDALVGGLGVGGTGAALVLQSVLEHTDAKAAATATAATVALPVGDLMLLALVVAAITVTGWRASGAWRWIASAFALYAVVDSIYLVKLGQGTFASGTLVDLGWPAAALLLGVAAWRTEPLVNPGVRTGTMQIVPVVFGFASLALLVLNYFVRTNPVALSLATASICVMLVRLYLTVKDNARLLAHSRREATTDALTGLGNRRRLATDLAGHLRHLDPDRPLLLTLFDLDGFKRYNDTFGHPAGDQLLVRISARLRNVLDGRGTAYRMGGDEFCALWHLADADQASVATLEAQAALSERGEAFSIGCSYGSVLLPNESSDSSAALRVADRRMYFRKGSGRTSAGSQSSDVLLRALTECDSELGEHLDSVADLACATAMRLGVPHEPMEAMRQTALLHDVGKVAIPDEILNKPGPLDDSEWAFMQRHTIIGERIISAAPALAAVAKFVRSTHERYDGTGYPDGLAGNNIPLVARTVAVCDAYHAMVTHRAYRDAFEGPRAIAELRRCSGTQFDPEVVEAFISALELSSALNPARSHGLGAGASVHA